MVLKRNLTQKERERLFCFLLQRLQNNELRRGAIQTAATEFSVTRGTVSRLWKRWNAARANPLNNELDIGKLVSSGKYGNEFALKYNFEDLRNSVREIAVRHRRTVRPLATMLGISKTHLNRLIKEQGLF
jgi:hypothetical protein